MRITEDFTSNLNHSLALHITFLVNIVVGQKPPSNLEKSKVITIESSVKKYIPNKVKKVVSIVTPLEQYFPGFRLGIKLFWLLSSPSVSPYSFSFFLGGPLPLSSINSSSLSAGESYVSLAVSGGGFSAASAGLTTSFIAFSAALAASSSAFFFMRSSLPLWPFVIGRRPLSPLL